jgi:integrase
MAMDATITGIGAVVVAELRSAGYMESTVGQYEMTIRMLAGYAQGRGTDLYTPALGAGFASLTAGARTARLGAGRRREYRRLATIFDSVVTTGRADLTVRKRGGGGPRPVGEQFVRLDGSWEREMAERGLAAATREAYGRVVRGYLSFLESGGIFGLDEAGGGTVLAFLASLPPRWATTTLFWVVSNLRPFLAFTGRADLVDAAGLAGVRRSHPIIPVLGDEDERMVVHACASDAVCSRDAAITLLALSTGLRACDIIGLRLGDVDWRGRTLCIVQQKSGNPVIVPLTGLLFSRLADYVLHDRPPGGDDHVFLRRLAPHVRLADHATIHRVTTTVFRTAGVTDVRTGTRFLRHNAASRMLRAATPLPTIAAVLGHASQESTQQYLSIDEGRLADCVLPVPESARP